MKITPVNGTAITGAVGTTTGLSAEKIARLKDIAAGKTPAEITEAEASPAAAGKSGPASH